MGLTAALVLGGAGWRVTVAEAETEPPTLWRASTFHPPTLELCEDLGLVSDMLRQGLVAPTYQLRDRATGIIAEFDFTAIADATRYPYRLQLEQYKYVRLLLDRLSDMPNVHIRYGHRVIGYRVEDDRTVRAHVRTENGEAALAARYLIGADGARSTVRQQLGVDFEGATYEHRYLLLSVDAPLEQYFPGISYVNYFSDPVEHLMVLRIPDVWRVMFEVPEEPSDEEALSDNFITARLRALLDPHPLPPLLSRQLYRVHQRVAESFRNGPIVLIGDAAHVNSPIGGMGLNSGIHDAYTLARTLLASPSGEGLNDWAEQRRRVALEEIQRITHRNTADLSERDLEARNARLVELSAIANDSARARAWMLEAAMITSARAHGLVPAQLIGSASGDEIPRTSSKDSVSAGPNFAR